MCGHDRKLRAVALLVAALVLLEAGCGDDDPATGAVTATTQSPATTQPAAESTTSLSSAEEEVDATVVYEPGNCTYLGPAVIPRGTRVTFEFDDGGHTVQFVVGLAIEGTTREEIIEFSETYGGPDADLLGVPYYSAGPVDYQHGSGSMVVEFRDDGDWSVECLTRDYTNKRYLGGMIKVIAG